VWAAVRPPGMRRRWRKLVLRRKKSVQNLG
jgi:hypothetical protein